MNMPALLIVTRLLSTLSRHAGPLPTAVALAAFILAVMVVA